MKENWCEDCKYYQEPRGEDSYHGWCKFNPPQIDWDFGDYKGVFPLVYAGEWCGKWEAKAND